MRIALICDDYLPGSTRVSAKMMHELARELLQRGHEPIVVTPDCYIKSIYKVEQLDGVDILRFRNGRIKDVSKIKRAMCETLLSYNGWKAVNSYFSNDVIDAVIYYSPSIFFGPLVNKIKRKWSCPSFLILRDSFPQWVIDEGLIREGSLICRYFRFFEKINYQAADTIGVMSERNRELFLNMHPNIQSVEVLYNWCDTRADAELDLVNKPDCITKIADKIIFLYGGNIGKAQDMGNLIRLAIAMKTYSNVHFIFIGQGDEYDFVSDSIKKYSLSNVSLFPSVSQHDFKVILKFVHVGLFSLSKKHTAHNFPGKLLGYMKNSLPILGSVNSGNDLSDVINNNEAGCVCDNGDDNALLRAAIRLATDQDYRYMCGQKANQLLHEKFSVTSAIDNIMKHLSKKTQDYN
ncbi:glycosyltransferase family 4 protein [Escherichia albertii]|uniref:Colanic acid biosynthesis glycosyltransferase n=2 Tax=Enterobacteriaceae TaxID=543 RepID=A0A5A4U8V8_ESCAL|nr:glycosyltransferase family 4 protein [Escherichia albertii]AAR24277.1 glycosyltransferase [Shigella boydii]EFG1229163.1 glycosyltransferase family 4 protein [Escherichia albertii]EFZ2303321.1 glycosyltransferase family 4 protein [Shigella boydii]EFZ6210955.1 glycosyltransferase family 4 protein [Shigella boydii]EFZ6297625.1 glycosyltransferase family 4 protein [Shigella boydii]